ncbi:hypothetical protein GWI33_009992 [Rhynchophorus ferrugineus]|uniref:Uncharacterized protein n=1 Tax=Rhynchophorus ferrugineus TaxID=354439 RepID=A0A834IDJ0_RHYFE|nr:hypothetical protein GWI33_009992 [Rhynchophorus ferrugineus]
MVAQFTTKTSHVELGLPKSLATSIELKQQINAHSTGRLSTDIAVDHTIHPMLKGKYPAQLAFKTVVPVKVRIQYNTFVLVDDVLSLDSTTDLVYQKKYLPKLPIKLDLPLKLKVPFKLDQEFDLMVAIDFNDHVIFDFNELLNVHVKHHFRPVLDIDDDISLNTVSAVEAQLINRKQDTNAQLKATVDIPLRNISP